MTRQFRDNGAIRREDDLEGQTASSFPGLHYVVTPDAPIAYRWLDGRRRRSFCAAGACRRGPQLGRLCRSRPHSSAPAVVALERTSSGAAGHAAHAQTLVTTSDRRTVDRSLSVTHLKRGTMASR